MWKEGEGGIVRVRLVSGDQPDGIDSMGYLYCRPCCTVDLLLIFHPLRIKSLSLCLRDSKSCPEKRAAITSRVKRIQRRAKNSKLKI